MNMNGSCFFRTSYIEESGELGSANLVSVPAEHTPATACHPKLIFWNSEDKEEFLNGLMIPTSEGKLVFFSMFLIIADI